jgi:hypothetical protein
MIDTVISENPFADIHVFGDFNVHHKEWLVHSNKTDPCHVSKKVLKLVSHDVSGNVLSVIKSFSTNRSLKVVVYGQSSEAQNINAGVLQGSLLGSTLFLIFINDLPHIFYQ